MAFEGMSFNLFTDSALLVGFSGTYQLVQHTDLSDNPQDNLLYLGSLTGTNQLQATSDPGVDNIIITPIDILPEWTNAHSYTSGDRVQAVGGDGFVYKCTTSGTSGGSEPTWNAGGLGSTTTDNTVVWTKLSAKHELTEIILGLSSGDLDINTPGNPLSLSNTILGGTGEAVPVYIRFVNAVTNASNNTAHEELALYINEVVETAIP